MEKIVILENLGCANCAAKMERAIEKIKGVQSVSINFMTKKMFIEANEEEMEGIMKEASKKILKIERQVVIKEN